MKEFVAIVERDNAVPIDYQCSCDHLWFYDKLVDVETGRVFSRPNCIICGHLPAEHISDSECGYRIPYQLSQAEQDRRELLQIIREYWDHYDWLFEE